MRFLSFVVRQSVSYKTSSEVHGPVEETDSKPAHGHGIVKATRWESVEGIKKGFSVLVCVCLFCFLGAWGSGALYARSPARLD